MVSLGRRELLAAIGAGGAGLAGAGYWFSGDDGRTCPPSLEPTHEYRRSVVNTWSRPVSDEGTFFVGSGAAVTRMSAETKLFRLLALDSTGEPEWVARRELAGGIGTPTPTDTHVFAATGGNTLFALDRMTGRFQWEFDAGNHDAGSMAVETLADGDTVIGVTNHPARDVLEADFSVIALDATDGSIRWTTELSGEVSSGLALVDGTVVAVSRDGVAIGIDPSDGDRLWTTDLEGSVGWNAVPKAFAASVWIPREDGVTVGLAPSTGERTKRLSVESADDREEASDVDHAVVLERGDDSLIVGDSNGAVAAYDRGLSQRWRHEGAAQMAAVSVQEERLGVLDQRGIYSELDRETGSLQRSFLLTEINTTDRCGFDPSEGRLAGLSKIGQSFIVTGFLFGTKRYVLPLE